MRYSGRLALPALSLLIAGVLLGAGCGAPSTRTSDGGPLQVVTTTSYLADMAQNVAGDRFQVSSLVPRGADPHAFEPAPSDLRSAAEADVLIVNGGGLEGPLLDTLKNAGGDAVLVDASAGLRSRTPQPGEPALESGGTDPHFWLDPVLAEKYVSNISAALTAADPAGEKAYTANAAAYIARLRHLDEWISAQVATIPPTDRKLVMNHASHGYFADRYGFAIIGTVIPSVGTDETPTAKQLGDLTTAIRDSGVKAIFVEADESPRLARQIAAETGIAVVDDLLDHSLTEADGVAPTYIDMLRFDTRRIVEALRP